MKNLREKAEDRLQQNSAEKETVDLDTTRKLLHELRVHQVELEMQNDELKQTQKELENVRDRYMFLFNHAPNGYIIIDSKGIIHQSNQTFAKMIGEEYLDLKGIYFFSLVAEKDRDCFLSRFKAFFKQPVGKRIELELIPKNRSPIHASLEATHPPKQSGFEEDRLLLSVLDVSQKKADADQIENSLKEKTVLLQEIHHRVKNNMQVISSMLGLQKNKTKDKRLQAILKDSQMRVQTMASIHESLYKSDDFSEVDIKSHLERLMTSIQENYHEDRNRITIHMEIEKIGIDVKQATPLGMIVNELVSNCFKHAFPDNRSGEISIKFGRNSIGEIELMVADNGIGIPENLDPDQSDSLGLNLVRILGEGQLKGNMEFSNSKGSLFKISFKDRRLEQPLETGNPVTKKPFPKYNNHG